MAKEANALSLEQAANLLRLKYSDLKRIGRKQIYISPIGRIYYRGSKNYGFSHTDWWYSIHPNIVIDEHVDFLCLAADYSGVFLIPTQKFLEYRENNIVGKVKGGRENFNIIKEGNNFIRRESNCQDWDITEYFRKAN